VTYAEKDIVYEDGDYFVIQVPKGYEAYRCGVTHATCCGIIGFKNEPARAEKAWLWCIDWDKRKQSEKK
jgi:hypothetical protein